MKKSKTKPKKAPASRAPSKWAKNEARRTCGLWATDADVVSVARSLDRSAIRENRSCEELFASAEEALMTRECREAIALRRQRLYGRKP